jgi:hypothetical protein
MAISLSQREGKRPGLEAAVLAVVSAKVNEETTGATLPVEPWPS